MLTRMTRNTPFAYQKKRLRKAYLDSGAVAAVRAVMPDVGFFKGHIVLRVRPMVEQDADDFF